MSYVELYESEEEHDQSSYFNRFNTRKEIISTIDSSHRIDLLVVGGGIHGACVARQAAFNGLKTVLLEKGDYASATSSRSSKMAHGGLRYLEMFDFKQVFEGIKARENLFQVAPHLVKPHQFLIPLFEANWFERIRLRIGLWLYDLFVRKAERKAFWAKPSKLNSPVLAAIRKDLVGGFIYTDGLMDDTRVVLEEIVAARQEGAECLNYARVISIAQRDDGSVEVGWQDQLTGEHHSVVCGSVINCAGPWVAEVGRVKPGPLARRLKFSRGSHILFDQKWEGPALFLPMEGKSRYYFVWPHPAGTLVGTTEREIEQIDDDPQPSKDEIQEILDRLEKDLPGSGLDRESAFYAFAGVRTLALESEKPKSVAEISRRHHWVYSQGVLSLLGGKYTSAAWTAEEGLKELFKQAGLTKKLVSLKDRPLPGGALYEQSLTEFRVKAVEANVPKEIVERVVRLYGSRVRYFLEDESKLEVVGGQLLRAELELAFQVEQAETLEDLMRRRLELEWYSGHGVHLLDFLCGELAVARPELDIEAERAAYLERLERVHELLGNHRG